MNLIDGVLIKEGNTYKQKCGKAEFILPSTGKNLQEHLNKTTILGIRPQYINISKETTGNEKIIRSIVFSYEYLGDSGYLVLDCENIKILIEVEHERIYNIGESVNFYFQEEYICLFDKSSGERII